MDREGNDTFKAPPSQPVHGSGSAEAGSGDSGQQGREPQAGASTGGPADGLVGLPVMLFDTKRPQHLGEGLQSAMKNISVGATTGVASIAVGTAMGAKQKGVIGGVAGFFGGVVVGTGLLVGGLLTGAQQAVNGLLQTPSCIVHTVSNEQLWDEISHRWIRFELDAAFLQLPATDDDLFSKYAKVVAPEDAARPEIPPEECATLLGMDAHAVQDPAAVRKAYLKMALTAHPDKNPGDPSAADRFRRVNEAYQTLQRRANQEARRSGAVPVDSSVQEGDTTLTVENPVEQALGTRLFEPFIGRQTFLLYFAHLRYCSASLPKELLDTFTRRRSIRIAHRLVRLLGTFADATNDLRPLLRSMMEVPLGPELLHLIGERYLLVGRVYLHARNPLEQVAAASKRFWATAESRWKLVKGVWERDSLRSLFALVRPDIIFAVDWAARMALHDCGVDVGQREERAQGLLLVGTLFIEVAQGAVETTREGSEPPGTH